MVTEIKKNSRSYLIIILAAFAAYWPSSNAPVMLDDIAVLNAIREGSLFEYVAAVFTLKSRALSALSFRLNFEIHEGWLFGYRFANLAIHCVNSIVVYSLIVKVFEYLRGELDTARISRQFPAAAVDLSAGRQVSRLVTEIGEKCGLKERTNLPALAGALVFAIHPIQVQAVSYIAQRFVLLSAMFYLLAVYHYFSFRDAGKRTLHMCLVCLFALCAVMSKEIAVTLPVAIILVDRIFPSKTRPSLATKMKIYIPLLAIACVPVAVRLLLGDASAPWVFTRSGFSDNAGVTYLTYAVTQLNVLAEYLRLIAWPARLHFIHDVTAAKAFFQLDVFFSFLLHVLFFVLAILLKKRQPLVAFGIFFFYIAHFVESFTVPLIFSMFEYRCYLSMVGSASLLAAILDYAFKHLSAWGRRCFSAFVFSVLAVLLAASVWQNILYTNPVLLWTRSAEMSPKQPLTHAWLGMSYMDAGFYKEAIWQFLIARQMGILGMDRKIEEARAAIQR